MSVASTRGPVALKAPSGVLARIPTIMSCVTLEEAIQEAVRIAVVFTLVIQ